MCASDLDFLRFFAYFLQVAVDKTITVCFFMHYFKITGMSCTVCRQKIERVISSLDGVDSCSVNLLDGTATAEGKADPLMIADAIRRAGYGAEIISAAADNDKTCSKGDAEYRKMLFRLLLSAVLLVPLIYVSMGTMIFSFPGLTAFDEPFTKGLTEMFLTLAIMTVNRDYFVRGFKSLFSLAPDMNTLVSLGSLASFIWSCRIFLPDAFLHASDHMDDCMYFESAAMILTLVTLGRVLEARARYKTVSAVRQLQNMRPAVAVVQRGDREVEISADELSAGDVFIVRPGGIFPADGIVIEGASSVDESSLTGESIPADKQKGDRVSAASVNFNGVLKCRATGTGADTLFSKLIRLVAESSVSKAPIERVADRIARVFVPAVMLLSLLTFLIWVIIGAEPGTALKYAVSVLVISCPCSLGLATPVAVMVGAGVAARCGIIFKSAAVMEKTCRISNLAVDKTGTLTCGKMVVTDIVPCGGVELNYLLTSACSLEHYSEHPVARAVQALESEFGSVLHEASDIQIHPGNGITGRINGRFTVAGNSGFIRRFTGLSAEAESKFSELVKQGKTAVFFAEDGILLGIMGIADVLRDDSRDGVELLKKSGVNVVMLSGDNTVTASAVGRKAGIDEIIAELDPVQKAEYVRSMKKSGVTAMAGDGVNDAPALAASDIGISVQSGTDIAADTADIILFHNRITDIYSAVRISRLVLRNIYENFFWAFIYNVSAIPLAAGVFSHWLGWQLSPVTAAGAMSLSSFCVVMNALRLNLIGIQGRNSRDMEGEAFSGQKTELNARDCFCIAGAEIHSPVSAVSAAEAGKNRDFTCIMSIDGMMCSHCEEFVKKILEGIDGVVSADVSHSSGTAKLVMRKRISEDILKNSVEKEDYSVLSIVFDTSSDR